MITPVPIAPVLDLTLPNMDNLVDELRDYHAIYSPLFRRREQRAWALSYLHGLMLNLERKSIEPIVHALHGSHEKDVRALQSFINAGAWEDESILRQHWREVDATLGDDAGVLLLSCGTFSKKGHESVGVARQCKGKWTKYFNCQVGVFLSYASTAGVTLLDRRLYLPQAWVDDPTYEKRRQHCGIPADTVFQPREALALDMLRTVVAAGSPRCRWMVADTSLACAPQFRKAVADLKLWYFVEPHRIPGVPIGGYGSISDSRSPNFQEQRRIMKGRNETVPVDVVARRIASEPAERPEPDVWAVLCQDVERSTTTYLSNAPADICPTALMQMCNTCWLPPTCIETSKRLRGMGDYEVRSWRGWHHHMTLVILAHFFLVRMHMRQQPGPDNVRATPSEMDTRTSLER